MRFLAPVGRGAGRRRRSRDGERVFAAIGCATCHVPSLETGPSANPLFDRQRRRRCSRTCCCTTSAPATASGRARAAPDEIRTPALWGLRFRRPLLHDGSAATIEDAIGATATRPSAPGRLRALPPMIATGLLAFLRSL